MRLLVATYLFVLATSCGEEPAAPPAGFTTVDSGGVVVVTNTGPRFGTRSPVRFSGRPVTRIGEGDAPGEPLGFVPDATRLTDGRVVVADLQSADVRVFDDSGRFLVTWGGPGQGPGEFRSPRTLTRLPADSVAVLDIFARRMTVFASDGEVAATVPFRFTFAGQGMMSQSCCVPVGALTSNTAIWRYPSTWGIEGLGDRPTASEVVVATGEETRSVGVFQSGIAAPWPDGVNPVVEKHFSTRLAVAVRGSEVVMGTGSHLGFDTRRIEDGSLLTRVRSDQPRQPVTDEVLDGWADQLGGNRSPEATPRRIEQILAIPTADSLPAYEELVVAEDGAVWLREPDTYRLAGLEPGYQVFGRGGEWLGKVDVPRQIRILEVGRDYVLGVTRGDFDETYVEVWAIEPAYD